MLRRTAILIYGIACYAIFLGTFLYGIGFIGGFGVPTKLDGAPSRPLGAALLINLVLLTIFVLQHSLMARPAFKRQWTRLVPDSIERSTYVLFSSLALILLFTFWQPLGGKIWHIETPLGRALLWGLFAAGWLTVLVATFLINHFDLFGLRQVWLAFRGDPYSPLAFKTPGPYRLVRHPLYVGWLTVFWATPTMTAGHLCFAVATTVYILVAIRFEEHDLLDFHGAAYAEYRQRVPMLFPAIVRWRGSSVPRLK
jgi:protein-S-isoprenylcysteine O-methyltransferase Ste14